MGGGGLSNIPPGFQRPKMMAGPLPVSTAPFNAPRPAFAQTGTGKGDGALGGASFPLPLHLQAGPAGLNRGMGAFPGPASAMTAAPRPGAGAMAAAAGILPPLKMGAMGVPGGGGGIGSREGEGAAGGRGGAGLPSLPSDTDEDFALPGSLGQALSMSGRRMPTSSSGQTSKSFSHRSQGSVGEAGAGGGGSASGSLGPSSRSITAAAAARVNQGYGIGGSAPSAAMMALSSNRLGNDAKLSQLVRAAASEEDGNESSGSREGYGLPSASSSSSAAATAAAAAAGSSVAVLVTSDGEESGLDEILKAAGIIANRSGEINDRSSSSSSSSSSHPNSSAKNMRSPSLGRAGSGAAGAPLSSSTSAGMGNSNEDDDIGPGRRERSLQRSGLSSGLSSGLRGPSMLSPASQTMGSPPSGIASAAPVLSPLERVRQQQGQQQQDGGLLFKPSPQALQLQAEQRGSAAPSSTVAAAGAVTIPTTESGRSRLAAAVTGLDEEEEEEEDGHGRHAASGTSIPSPATRRPMVQVSRQQQLQQQEDSKLDSQTLSSAARTLTEGDADDAEVEEREAEGRAQGRSPFADLTQPLGRNTAAAAAGTGAAISPAPSMPLHYMSPPAGSAAAAASDGSSSNNKRRSASAKGRGSAKVFVGDLPDAEEQTSSFSGAEGLPVSHTAGLVQEQGGDDDEGGRGVAVALDFSSPAVKHATGRGGQASASSSSSSSAAAAAAHSTGKQSAKKAAGSKGSRDKEGTAAGGAGSGSSAAGMAAAALSTAGSALLQGLKGGWNLLSDLLTVPQIPSDLEGTDTEGEEEGGTGRGSKGGMQGMEELSSRSKGGGSGSSGLPPKALFGHENIRLLPNGMAEVVIEGRAVVLPLEDVKGALLESDKHKPSVRSLRKDPLNSSSKRAVANALAQELRKTALLKLQEEDIADERMRRRSAAAATGLPVERSIRFEEDSEGEGARAAGKSGRQSGSSKQTGAQQQQQQRGRTQTRQGPGSPSDATAAAAAASSSTSKLRPLSAGLSGLLGGLKKSLSRGGSRRGVEEEKLEKVPSGPPAGSFAAAKGKAAGAAASSAANASAAGTGLVLKIPGFSPEAAAAAAVAGAGGAGSQQRARNRLDSMFTGAPPGAGLGTMSPAGALSAAAASKRKGVHFDAAAERAATMPEAADLSSYAGEGEAIVSSSEGEGEGQRAAPPSLFTRSASARSMTSSDATAILGGRLSDFAAGSAPQPLSPGSAGAKSPSKRPSSAGHLQSAGASSPSLRGSRSRSRSMRRERRLATEQQQRSAAAAFGGGGAAAEALAKTRRASFAGGFGAKKGGTAAPAGAGWDTASAGFTEDDSDTAQLQFTTDSNGLQDLQNPLHRCCKLCRLGSKEGDWKTALLQACAQGHKPCLRAAMEAASASPLSPLTAKDALNRTPVHLAAAFGSDALLPRLQDYGFPMADADSAGYTPLHHAALYAHTGAVTFLLQAAPAAQYAVEAENGWTPLHLAAWCGSDDAVRLLVDGGSDLEAQDTAGRAPLHMASTGPAAAALITAGANVLCKDMGGQLPLHLAAYAGAEQALAVLCEAMEAAGQGAELNDQEATYGYTPLHCAAYGGHKACVQSLLDCGCSLDVKDASGQTALETAALYKHDECAGLLLRAAMRRGKAGGAGAALAMEASGKSNSAGAVRARRRQQQQLEQQAQLRQQQAQQQQWQQEQQQFEQEVEAQRRLLEQQQQQLQGQQEQSQQGGSPAWSPPSLGAAAMEGPSLGSEAALSPAESARQAREDLLRQQEQEEQARREQLLLQQKQLQEQMEAARKKLLQDKREEQRQREELVEEEEQKRRLAAEQAGAAGDLTATLMPGLPGTRLPAGEEDMASSESEGEGQGGKAAGKKEEEEEEDDEEEEEEEIDDPDQDYPGSVLSSSEGEDGPSEDDMSHSSQEEDSEEEEDDGEEGGDVYIRSRNRRRRRQREKAAKAAAAAAAAAGNPLQPSVHISGLQLMSPEWKAMAEKRARAKIRRRQRHGHRLNEDYAAMAARYAAVQPYRDAARGIRTVTCLLCHKEPVKHAFLPCEHACVCDGCLKECSIGPRFTKEQLLGKVIARRKGDRQKLLASMLDSGKDITAIIKRSVKGGAAQLMLQEDGVRMESPAGEGFSPAVTASLAAAAGGAGAAGGAAGSSSGGGAAWDMCPCCITQILLLAPVGVITPQDRDLSTDLMVAGMAGGAAAPIDSRFKILFKKAGKDLQAWCENAHSARKKALASGGEKAMQALKLPPPTQSLLAASGYDDEGAIPYLSEEEGEGEEE